jgi:proline iminopeptidase
VIGSAIYYPRVFSQALRQSLKLIFADHRGFAHLSGDVPPSEYALDAVLADIDLVRRHLGFEKVIVVGHSGHGYMALEYAKRYSQHVSHVVMIATGPSHSAAHNAATEQYWQESVCPERKAQLKAIWRGCLPRSRPRRTSASSPSACGWAREAGTITGSMPRPCGKACR